MSPIQHKVGQDLSSVKPTTKKDKKAASDDKKQDLNITAKSVSIENVSNSQLTLLHRPGSSEKKEAIHLNQTLLPSKQVDFDKMASFNTQAIPSKIEAMHVPSMISPVLSVVKK